MKIHDITKQALTDDLNWEPREGFIVVWSMIDYALRATDDQPSYYVWGMGPSSTASKPAGWSTAKHAIIYSTYAEAAAQSRAIVAAYGAFDDMPVGLLQRLAEI